MNFLIDAQLPRKLVHHLRAAGHDATHTLDLPKKNRTTDSEINDISERERRVVVTKDTEFVDSYLLARRPPKLLLISTGNIRNNELNALFAANIAAIAAVFASHNYAELTRTALIVHG